jgi:hypothetical protein
MSTLAYDNFPDVQRSEGAATVRDEAQRTSAAGGRQDARGRSPHRRSRRSCRAHSLSPNLGRTASPILPDLIYDRHPLSVRGRIPSGAAANLRSPSKLVKKSPTLPPSDALRFPYFMLNSASLKTH